MRAIELTDVLAAIADEMKIKFMFGPVDEVIMKLSAMSKTPTTNTKRYPLLVLFTDVAEQRGQDVGTSATITIPSIIIAHVTLQSYTAEQRMEKVFKPVLLPLYEMFLSELEENTTTQVLSRNLIPHTKINRLAWGRTALFTERDAGTDFIDAIEIQNLQLSLYYKC